ncbi:MAG: GtrA family protein [Bacteroidales bacterium]|jgi:putative flippase GtrA|nr:GtrA family protein [Bacteroidales bacterium]
MSKISHLISKEFIRFAIVGVVATGIHYGVYLLLLQVIQHDTLYRETVAYSIGYVVSFVFNFILTNVFTFKTKANVKKTIGFAMSHAINYGLHIMLLNFFLWLSLPQFTVVFKTYELLVTPVEYAPILVYAIAVPVNFLLVRFVFKSKWTQ